MNNKVSMTNIKKSNQKPKSLAAHTAIDEAKPKRKLGQGSGDYWVAADFDNDTETTRLMNNGEI